MDIETLKMKMLKVNTLLTYREVEEMYEHALEIKRIEDARNRLNRELKDATDDFFVFPKNRSSE